MISDVTTLAKLDEDINENVYRQQLIKQLVDDCEVLFNQFLEEKGDIAHWSELDFPEEDLKFLMQLQRKRYSEAPRGILGIISDIKLKKVKTTKQAFATLTMQMEEFENVLFNSPFNALKSPAATIKYLESLNKYDVNLLEKHQRNKIRSILLSEKLNMWNLIDQYTKPSEKFTMLKQISQLKKRFFPDDDCELNSLSEFISDEAIKKQFIKSIKKGKGAIDP